MLAKKMAATCICALLTSACYAQNNINNDNWGYYSDEDEVTAVRQYQPYYPAPTPKPIAIVKKTSYKGEELPPQKMVVQDASRNLFYLGAYGGYGYISSAYQQDGQFVQGRLATGAAYSSGAFIVGAELGFQSGNTMHLSIDNDLVLATGGLEWLATLKPLVDFLITAKFRVMQDQPFYINVKGGIAYRQLQLDDRNSSSYFKNLTSPEAQLGVNYGITRNAMISLFYQGIYSNSNVGASINDFGNGTISNIPTQQAVFLGVEYSF